MSKIFRFFARALISARGWLGRLFGLGSVPVVTLARVRPGMGWRGTLLTLDGNGFSDTLDGNLVEIGGDTALVVRASVTQLTVLVGEHATSGPIRVALGGATAMPPIRS
jgi:hypothetical protein